MQAKSQVIQDKQSLRSSAVSLFSSLLALAVSLSLLPVLLLYRPSTNTTFIVSVALLPTLFSVLFYHCYSVQGKGAKI